MDTKIAAALNSLNLNSQQKRVINEVLDNKFKYIDANEININNISYEFTLRDYINYYSRSVNNNGVITFEIRYNNFIYSFIEPTSKETSDLTIGKTCSKGLYYSGTSVSEPYQLGYNFTKDQIVAFGANSSLGILKGTGLTFTMTFDNDIFSINYNHANDKMSINTNIYAKDFVIEDESNTISVKDTIQDIYDKINNNSNDDGSDITQTFIDREIEELIYKTAEIRSKDTEYFTGEEFKELVISEKKYNKYNYTWNDNTVHNYLYEQYNKIVVYKDILTKTINITNSNGEQEEINVLIVE